MTGGRRQEQRSDHDGNGNEGETPKAQDRVVIGSGPAVAGLLGAHSVDLPDADGHTQGRNRGPGPGEHRLSAP